MTLSPPLRGEGGGNIFILTEKLSWTGPFFGELEPFFANWAFFCALDACLVNRTFFLWTGPFFRDLGNSLWTVSFCLRTGPCFACELDSENVLHISVSHEICAWSAIGQCDADGTATATNYFRPPGPLKRPRWPYYEIFTVIPKSFGVKCLSCQYIRMQLQKNNSVFICYMFMKTGKRRIASQAKKLFPSSLFISLSSLPVYVGIEIFRWWREKKKKQQKTKTLKHPTTFSRQPILKKSARD